MDLELSAAVERLAAGGHGWGLSAVPAGTVSLAIGEPDFATPAPILDAAHTALRDGYTHYGDWDGDAELRELIAQDANATAALRYRASQAVVGHGGTGVITAAILALVNPGDRVVICEPTYPVYAQLTTLVGGICVFVPTLDDHHPDIERLAAAAQGARLLVVCSPSNPTGAVLSATELAALGELLAGTRTVLLCDEAYCDLVYDGHVFCPAWSIPSLGERLIACRTLSKSYAMTGWRLGYALAPQALADAMKLVHRTINASVNSMVQRAAVAAISAGHALSEPMRREYQRRRAFVMERLLGISGLSARAPEGAFYVFPRYRAALQSNELAATLAQAGVIVQPGSWFGPSGEHHIRISFATDLETLGVGLERIARVLRDLARESAVASAEG